MQAHENVSTRVLNEILKHDVLTKNRYTEWFSETEDGPSTGQVKDFVIQMSVLAQESVVMRRKRSVDAAKAEVHLTDEQYMSWLHNVANALPIDLEKDLKGHSLGFSELWTRETRHALHQLPA